MTALITMSLLSLLFLGPLVWRLWRDRLESRALELQAEIQAAINASLGGESMIAVRVNAGSREQSGTVELFVPAGGEDILVSCGWQRRGRPVRARPRCAALRPRGAPRSLAPPPPQIYSALTSSPKAGVSARTAALSPSG